MKRAMSLAVFFLLGWSCARAAETHGAKGIVLKVDAAHRTLIVSCEAIPNYMDAMEMPFSVRDSASLAGMKPGTAVSFTIVERGKDLFAENIRVRVATSLESEPLEAGQLTALHKAMHPEVKALTVGERVPDFVLTDQTGKEVRLSQFEGKVVLLTFGYSRCPNPNYCFRLSNNLARVEKRFHSEAGRDLVLMTIVIDPEHDQGAELVKYAGCGRPIRRCGIFLQGRWPRFSRLRGDSV